MKIKSIVLASAVFAGLLSASSFASVVANETPNAFAAKFAAPVPSTVVNPTGLLRRHEGETVTLSLMIDAAGQPHDIRIVSNKDQNLTERLIPAVAQWKFTPAMKNGRPVSAKVLLPVQLMDGPVS